MQGLLQSGHDMWEYEQACSVLAPALSLPQEVLACAELSDAEYETLTAKVAISDADIVLEAAHSLHDASTSGLQLLQARGAQVNMKLTIVPVTTDAFQWSFDAVSSEQLQSSLQSLVEATVGNAVITDIIAIHRIGMCGNHRCELGELVRCHLRCCVQR